jgi:8-oxo-dGTP pyrophosphatase MutT (NUDIX family)
VEQIENIETEEENSAGAILCYVRNGDIEILLLTQNNAYYNRIAKAPVIDLGPKGQIQKGESEKDAALREIKEEIGLDLNLDEKFKEDLFYVFDAKSKLIGKRVHIRKKVAFFMAYITQGDIDNIKLSEEHLGCRLVNIENAIRETRHEDQKRVLRALKGYIESKA